MRSHEGQRRPPAVERGTISRRLPVLLGLLLFGWGATPTRAEWTPVPSVAHTALANLLTRSERLMAWGEPNHGERVEIYRIWEGPLTCGDTTESCPRQRLFIRINRSSGREAYLLPASFGWDNLRVNHYKMGSSDFTLLEVQENLSGKTPAMRPCGHRTGRILFNLHEAYIQRKKETTMETPDHGREPCAPPG
jgi:hypothetical protein